MASIETGFVGRIRIASIGIAAVQSVRRILNGRTGRGPVGENPKLSVSSGTEQSGDRVRRPGGSGKGRRESASVSAVVASLGGN